MGTHNYRMQMTGKGDGKDLSALLFEQFREENTNDYSGFWGHAKNWTFSHDVGCRERVMDFLRACSTGFFHGESQLLMGIRCYGELYAKNAEIIKQHPGAAKKISDFLSRVFDMVFVVRINETKPEEVAKKHLGRVKHTFTDENGNTVVRTYYKNITLYLRSYRNKGIKLSDVRISSVLAILREERIINGILSGEIKNVHDLSRELFMISFDRVQSKDFTYDCFALAGVGDSVKLHSKIMSDVRSSLSGTGNTDGSDWLSILRLAMFVEFQAETPTGNNFGVTCSFSGPAQFSDERISVTFKREFPENIGVTDIVSQFAAPAFKKLSNHSDAYELIEYWGRTYKKEAKMKLPKTSTEALYSSWATV